MQFINILERVTPNIIQFGHRHRRLCVVSLLSTSREAGSLIQKDVFPMRLRSEADVQEFLDAVSQCGGDVY